MENLQVIENTEVTAQYKEAISLHQRIMLNGELAYNYLVEYCKSLKEMRDTKLYTSLGYETFDDYAEQMAGIKGRQAYNYIQCYENLGPTELQANAKLGITKLLLLAQVPGTQRADFIGNNDLENMSTREIKALIEKSKEQVEQISFLSSKVDDLEAEKEELENSSESIGNLQDKLDHLTAENEKLKNCPTEVAVQEPSQADIDKIKAELEKEIKATYEKDKAKAISDAKAKAIADADTKHQKQLEQVRADAEKSAKNTFMTKLEAAEREKAILLEKAEKLAKESTLKGDTDVVKISVYFDNFKNAVTSLLDELKLVSNNDAEKGKKLANAVKAYTNQYLINALDEI